MKTLLLILSMSVAALAQELPAPAPSIELSTGYAYQKPGTAGLNGGNVALSINSDGGALAFVGEVAGYSITQSSAVAAVTGQTYVFHAGPRYYFRNRSSVTPFAHVLAGASYSVINGAVLGFSVADSSSSMEALAGGGVDVAVSPLIALRIVQIDYAYRGSQTLFSVSSGAVRGFRYSGGIIFRFY